MRSVGTARPRLQNAQLADPRVEEQLLNLGREVAGFTDDGRFVIFDVWESAQHEKRFSDERLGPAMREVMGDNFEGSPPREYSYELHNVVAPG